MQNISIEIIFSIHKILEKITVSKNMKWQVWHLLRGKRVFYWKGFLKTSGQALDRIWSWRPCGISLKLLLELNRKKITKAVMYQDGREKSWWGSLNWELGPLTINHFTMVIYLSLPPDSRIKAHQGLQFNLLKNWPFLAKQRCLRRGHHLLTSISTELAHFTLFRAITLPFPGEEPVYFHPYLSLAVEDIKSWPHRWQSGAKGLLGYSYVDISWL